jgi:hypothetical protein
MRCSVRGVVDVVGGDVGQRPSTSAQSAVIVRTYAVGVLSLRQSGTSSFLVCRFLPSQSAKNDKHMIATYHAAAGKNASL